VAPLRHLYFMRLIRAFVFAVMSGPLLAAPAFAQVCPAAPDTSAELGALIQQARDATDFRQGRAASDAMWQVWLRAPDAAAQEVLDAGMAARNSYDFIRAHAEFTRLTDYCPEYAEGWNQRAYISFLREDYASALPDLDRALGLQPRHVAAQSGRGLTLMNLGRIAEARVQMREAVANNPWLGEAALLAKGAPLGPEGDDI
jgi:Flp pilus assembly protein TadD